MNLLHGISHLPLLESSVIVAFDCETLQLTPEQGKLRLIQLAIPHLVVVIDLFKCSPSDYETLRVFFASDKTWVAHNAAFDVGWLQAYGWHLGGELRCTMLMNRLVSNGKKSKYGNKLADLAMKWLHKELDKTEQTSDWSGHLTVEQIEYAAKDAEILLDLHALISREATRLHLEKAVGLECRAIPAIAQMQSGGIPWNKEKLESVQKNYEYDIEKARIDFFHQFDEALPEGEKLPRDPDGSFNLRAKATGAKSGLAHQVRRYGEYKPAGFNIGSPAQLLKKFTALIGKPPYDERNKRNSACKAALAAHQADYPCITTYLEWKRLDKRRQMITSMLEKQHEDGFIRSSYMQCGAETLRMTSSGPNMQQVPRDEDFRACAEAPEGWVFIDADYSQAELRLAAAVSGDRTMIRAYQEEQDLHDLTATAIGCSRQIAKSANFGLLYGSGANGLRNYAVGNGISMTVDEATEVRKKWLETYSGIALWQQALSDQADRKDDTLAYTRIPVTNAIRYLPEEMNRLTVLANTPIQGAGAAMLKVALANLWRHLRKHIGDVSLAACVHDELLLVCKEELAEEFSVLLRKEMEFAGSLFMGEVPCIAEVKVGRNWSDVH